MKSVRSKRSGGHRARYAARLLFQFRVMVNGHPGARRLCEDRIILVRAPDARSALAKARAHGKAAQYHYRNPSGSPVFFEFVGVTDLLRLGVECGADEVRYDIVQKVKPMERRRELVPPPERLNAIAWEGSNKPLERADGQSPALSADPLGARRDNGA
jgi:hypothetical protein